MHGAVLVDGAGAALRPALLWPDSRAVAELARWRALADADRAALANPLVPGMTGPMLAWLAGYEPAIVEQRRPCCCRRTRCGRRCCRVRPLVTDRTDASATLLWDVLADDWSAAAVAAAGVSSSLLPVVRPGAEIVAPFEDVPVVVGGADINHIWTRPAGEL